MTRPLSLPELQVELDRLPAGDQWEIEKSDYFRIFGTDHPARDRLEEFAKGHGCDLTVTQSRVVLWKLHMVDRRRAK